MTRQSRNPGEKIRRSGKPIEITDHPPFTDTTIGLSPRRSREQRANWECPDCGHLNRGYLIQCWTCGTRFDGTPPL